MGDPYRKDDRVQKAKAQIKQWKDMAPAERKAWCLYFQGKGPRPGASPMKWADD